MKPKGATFKVETSKDQNGTQEVEEKIQNIKIKINSTLQKVHCTCKNQMELNTN